MRGPWSRPGLRKVGLPNQLAIFSRDRKQLRLRLIVARQKDQVPCQYRRRPATVERFCNRHLEIPSRFSIPLVGQQSDGSVVDVDPLAIAGGRRGSRAADLVDRLDLFRRRLSFPKKLATAAVKGVEFQFRVDLIERRYEDSIVPNARRAMPNGKGYSPGQRFRWSELDRRLGCFVANAFAVGAPKAGPPQCFGI